MGILMRLNDLFLDPEIAKKGDKTNMLHLSIYILTSLSFFKNGLAIQIYPILPFLNKLMETIKYHNHYALFII